MSEVKWIKLSTGLFDNRKIKQIERMPEGDALVVVWLKLLVLAGNVNDGGYVYFTNEIPYTEQLLATEFNRPLNIIQLALATFQKFGMIEIVEDIIHISNWEKYQNIEGMDKIREQTRERVANFRERQRLLGNVTRNVTVTQSNATDIDIEEDKEKEKEKKEEDSTKAAKRFTRPTFEEVEQYCHERNNKVNAQRFLDYYDSNGWKVGKNPMKDWKAAVRRWEDDDKAKKEKAKKPMDERKVSEDEFAWNPMDLMNRPRKGA